MSNAQKCISILLERLPKWELSSYEHQMSLDRLRDRLSSASDIHEELKQLYQVKGFADFALSLMWIAEKVEKDPSRDESTLNEETLVFSLFRQAIDATSLPAQPSMPTAAILDFPSSPGLEAAPPATPSLETDSIWGTAEQSPPSISTPTESTPLEVEQERTFVSLLERFLEAIQSGNDDRTSLLSDVINECNRVLTSASAADDYRQFCQMLAEFLRYISDNQYLDDVRVMNIISNIQDPFTQWVRSEPQNRVGLLDQAVDILRDFKTMFE